MTVFKTLSTIAMAAALATSVTAKGHDQSGTDAPGKNVGAETVGPAKTLGSTLGNGKKPDGPNGKSANAGKKN